MFVTNINLTFNLGSGFDRNFDDVDVDVIVAVKQKAFLTLYLIHFSFKFTLNAVKKVNNLETKCFSSLTLSSFSYLFYLKPSSLLPFSFPF